MKFQHPGERDGLPTVLSLPDDLFPPLVESISLAPCLNMAWSSPISTPIGPLVFRPSHKSQSGPFREGDR